MPPRRRIIFECRWCSKKFEDIPSSNRLFCSQSCQAKGAMKSRWGDSKKIKKRCLQCNIEFETYLSSGKTYCSRVCGYKSPNRCHTEDWIKKISQMKKGKKPKNFGKNFGGYGKNHYNWKGGITPINERIRKLKNYKDWRKKIFERDNYTCQICGKIGGKLNAHHKLNFSGNPLFRLDINNGLTLCDQCHKNTHFGEGGEKV